MNNFILTDAIVKQFCLKHTLNCFIRMLRFSVLDPNNKSAAEMYAEIDSLTNQDFQQILAEFRQNIKADILVVGNVTPKVGSIKSELTIIVIYANMLTIQVVIHMCML